MASFYQDMAALAVELLDEFGGDAQLVRTAPASASFDKATGRPLPAPAPQTLSVRAAVGPQNVTSDDGRVDVRTVATLLVEPLRGDKLVSASRTWIVGDVKVFEGSDGTAIAYQAEVSR